MEIDRWTGGEREGGEGEWRHGEREAGGESSVWKWTTAFGAFRESFLNLETVRPFDSDCVE